MFSWGLVTLAHALIENKSGYLTGRANHCFVILIEVLNWSDFFVSARHAFQSVVVSFLITMLAESILVILF